MHTPPFNGILSVAAALIWSVALGSAVGGVARFLVGGLVQRAAPGPFPYGTLLINMSGSLLLGFILRYALLTPELSAEWRAGLTIGLCGGFTTFSTFSVGSGVIARERRLTSARRYTRRERYIVDYRGRGGLCACAVAGRLTALQ